MSTAFKSLQSLHSEFIRKAKDGSVFIAPYSADSINEDTLFNGTTGEIATLPAGYTDLGWLTDAGAAFKRTITETAVTSWQSVSPTRSDRTADTTTLDVIAQETKAATIGLYTGVSGTEAHHTSGVVRIDTPSVPLDTYYRVLVVSEDTNIAAGSVYICRYLPRAKVTDIAQQNHDKADEIQWGVTFTGFVDSAVGTAESYIFGGPGWKSIVTSMGFTSESSSSSS